MLNPEIQQLISSKEEVLEPETLRTFHPELSEAEVNQILALTALHKTRIFWENYNAFEDITQALNGIIPTPTVLQGCSPEQVWFALDIAHKIYPDREFSTEVLKYIEFMFSDYGVFIFPEYLPIENPYLARAKDLAINGPFPLGEDTTEEVQAAKYLAIQEYLKQQETL
jgi:hypothetical protein